jgi:hypothetical protein
VVDRGAADLFRRHVPDRSQHRAFHRRRPRQILIARGPRHGSRLRQAKIENLEKAVARDEDVLRFQITMDEASGVCGRESGGELPREVDGPVRR